MILRARQRIGTFLLLYVARWAVELGAKIGKFD